MITDTLIDELKRYVKEHYKLVSLPELFSFPAQSKTLDLSRVGQGIMPGTKFGEVADKLSVFVKEKRQYETFAHTLEKLRKEKGMSEPELYKAAWVDRRLYSKIRNAEKSYKPTKDTTLQFAFALKLDESAFTGFLKNIGFALSDSSVRDLVFRFCVRQRIFDLHDVNALLLEEKQNVLCKELREV
jgi:transcriptional regulator with XRE-family HTH domain